MLVLKNFRFRCIHLNDTLEFYTNCLKMQLERKLEVTTRTYIYLRYMKGDVGLRFEYDRLMNQKLQESGGEKKHEVPISECDLLFYVQSIDQIVDTIRSGKYPIFVPPENINHDTRSCVVVDPNGIRIRLVDCVHSLIDSQMGARLGYLTVPVQEFHTLSKTIAFYQQVFGQLVLQLRKNTYRSAKEVIKDEDTITSASNILQTKKTERSNAGFVQQDSESFIEDHTTMVWLGQEPRNMATTLCLRHITSHQHNSDAISAIFASVRATKERFFLGITFTVPDIERSFHFVKEQDYFAVQVSPITAMQGMPRSFSFLDPAYINVEIADETIGFGRGGRRPR